MERVTDDEYEVGAEMVAGHLVAVLSSEPWLLGWPTMGERNSSETRVRPFFDQLITLDSSGESWLPRLLTAMPDGYKLGAYAKDPGRIVATAPEAGSRSEMQIGPPSAFVRWLLLNPERLNWQPAGGTKDVTKRVWREKLCSRDPYADPRHRIDAIAEGLRCMREKGEQRGAWWIFEGETHVDFYIETDRGVRIYVEGKRTEGLSPGTLWFRERSQFVRNLEAAREHAKGGPYACLLLSEVPIQVTRPLIASGLPHIDAAEKVEILSGYIGSMTWRDACAATNIDFASLPDKVLRSQVR